MSSNASTTSTTARQTVAGAYAEVTALRSEVGEIKNLLIALVNTNPVAVVEATTGRKAKAKTTKAGKAKASTKAKAEPKVETPEVAAKRASYSNFRNLRDVLKQHKADGAIKAGVTVRDAIEQGLMNEDGSLPGGKPAKATKGKATAPKVTAKVTRSEAAKVTPERRANGTIAPKVEWATRSALKAQGKTPKQVDKATMKAMKILNG